MINPFIYAAEHPVAFFGYVGYALLTILLAFGGASYAIRTTAKCVVTANRNNRQKDWWGDAFGGWLPPGVWILRAGSVLLALAGTSWAIGGLLWVVG